MGEWEESKVRVFIPQDPESSVRLQGLMDNLMLGQGAGERVVQGRP